MQDRGIAACAEFPNDNPALHQGPSGTAPSRDDGDHRAAGDAPGARPRDGRRGASDRADAARDDDEARGRQRTPTTSRSSTSFRWRTCSTSPRRPRDDSPGRRGSVRVPACACSSRSPATRAHRSAAVTTLDGARAAPDRRRRPARSPAAMRPSRSAWQGILRGESEDFAGMRRCRCSTTGRPCSSPPCGICPVGPTPSSATCGVTVWLPSVSWTRRPEAPRG